MPDFRLYVDETGDHTSCNDETSSPGTRYLGLVGIMMERDEPYDAFARALDELKKRHLPYDADEAPPVLHRSEIKNRTGPFYRLQRTEQREAFDADLLGLLNRTPFRVIAVVIDKVTHGRASHRMLSHSYHYCLLGMLERYCGLLARLRSRGDVLVESRGGSEDRLFEDAYVDLYENGATGRGFLTSAETKALDSDEALRADLVIDEEPDAEVILPYGHTTEVLFS